MGHMCRQAHGHRQSKRASGRIEREREGQHPCCSALRQGHQNLLMARGQKGGWHVMVAWTALVRGFVPSLLNAEFSIAFPMHATCEHSFSHGTD